MPPEMPNDEEEQLDIEETLESRAWRDALLNGDEKINRLVKLIDTRFSSASRRQREHRQELREDMQKLKRDLQPLIDVASVVRIFQHWPIMVGGFLAGGTLIAAVVRLMGA
jgi:hypothetical protein